MYNAAVYGAVSSLKFDMNAMTSQVVKADNEGLSAPQCMPVSHSQRYDSETWSESPHSVHYQIIAEQWKYLEADEKAKYTAMAEKDKARVAGERDQAKRSGDAAAEGSDKVMTSQL